MSGRVEDETRTEVFGGPRTGRMPDPAAARLFAALQSRAGHALVVADDVATAAALFERVDAQLVCQRRVRLAGDGLDAEAVMLALGADLPGPHRPRSGEAILAMMAAEARSAGLPILIVIVGAEDADPAALERLGALIESMPDARAIVRVVLIGGPRLEEAMARAQAQKLAARVVTTVRAPSQGGARWVLPFPMPRWDSSWRDTAQWIAGVLVALAGAVLLLTLWTGRDGEAPPAIDVAAKDDVPAVAAIDAAPEPAPEPAAVPEPPSAPEPGAAPEPAAPAADAAAPAAPEAPVAPAAAEAPVAPTPASVEATPAPRPTPAPKPARVLRQSLQVGAFRDPANARALAATLSARFPGVRIDPVTRDGVAYHCVRLGGFADQYALAARADALRAAGYSSLRVRD
jgi:hypothetical protein